MAIGKISGPMLQTDLSRQGVDLSVDTNLVYFDVTNRRLGINTVIPSQSLDVLGNVHLANLSILGNTITSDTGKIDLGTPSNVVLSGGTSYDVIYTDGAGNLAFGNINVIAGLDILTGNNVTLGSNTSGSFSNAVTISTTTTVTDAIAIINENVGNVTANITTLFSLVYANANVSAYLPGYFSTYSGNINAGSIISTFYGNIHADTITGNTGNVVTIGGTGALRFPVGTTANRPAGNIGDIRYNTDVAINTVEYYDGTDWIPFQNAITDQQIDGDGTNNAFALDKPSASSESIMVSINGTVQRPGSAYSVSAGNIVFTEVPAVGDIIDVRYIASATTAKLTGLVDDIGTTGNITAGAGMTAGTFFQLPTYANATARDAAIAVPAAGMMVFNLSTNKVEIRTTSTWTNLGP